MNKTKNIKMAEAGICFPRGFTSHALNAKIKKTSTKEDFALIVSELVANAAGVFTKNIVKAAPVVLSAKRLKEKKARAIIVNSGNANACTGSLGEENAIRLTNEVQKALEKKGFGSIKESEVLVASTGVIGQQLPIERMLEKIPALVEGLSRNGNLLARKAIMTTDLVHKEAALSVEIGGKEVRLGTMAKGSGMIHINMGTMLGFITTDCAISSELLDEALRESVLDTYNCVSVDGDTSTNDSLFILANGMAENPLISEKNEDYYAFLDALYILNTEMARSIASDGEGASHLLECQVRGASDKETARILAKSVISSSLVKAAFFGKDANWGRILCALGYSGGSFSPEKTNLSFQSEAGEVLVFEQGVPLDFDEEAAKKILSEKEIKILVSLSDGDAFAKAWGCDLTYDYVKINGDYRT